MMIAVKNNIIQKEDICLEVCLVSYTMETIIKSKRQKQKQTMGNLTAMSCLVSVTYYFVLIAFSMFLIIFSINA
jgi:hypothetical protein